MDNDNNSRFSDIVANDRFIFIIPLKHRPLIIYDTLTENIKSITEGVEVFTRHINPITVKCSCVLNNIIYVACCDENEVWSYNVITGKVSVFNFDISSSKGFVCASNDGESIWLLSNYGISITKWTPALGDYITYSEMPCQIDCYNYLYGSVNQDYAFSDIFFSDKYAYIIPSSSKKFIKIEKETGIISEWASENYCDDEPYSCYSKLLPKCRLVNKNDDVFIVSMPKGKIYKFNAEDESLSEINISINMDQIEDYLSGFRMRYGKYGCFESEFSSLSDFIQGKMDKSFNAEKQNEMFSEISNNLDGSCGMKIHSAVRKSFR